jgi:cytochrome c-type biogenesis protein
LEISVFVAFGAGLISFFSPCVLPIIPVYFSLMLNKNVLTIKQKKPLIFSSVFFILGFSLIFILLGVSITGIFSFLLVNKPLFTLIGGLVIVFLSLQLLGVLKFRFFQREKRPNFLLPLPFLGPFFLGMTFSFGWSPCIGPVLGAILTYAATTQDVKTSLILLTSFSAGMALPFLLIGLFWEKTLKIITHFKKLSQYVSSILSILLLGVGIWLIYKGIVLLSH